MPADDDNQRRSPRNSASKKKTGYRVIGTRLSRHDGVDKVTGRAQYGADLQLSGMLFGSVVRSPHAHAQIVSIDVRLARPSPASAPSMTRDDLSTRPIARPTWGKGPSTSPT